MRTRALGLSVKTLVLFVGATLVAGVGGSARAADHEYGSGDPFAYLAVSSTVSFDDRGDLWFWNWSDSTEAAAGATWRAGFRLGAPVAIELQGDFVDINSWDENDNWTITTNFRVYPTEYEALGIKGLLPDWFQPYGVAGVGVIGGSPPGDDYQLNGAFRLGVGSDFYVHPKIAISFGYEWITGTGYWSEQDVRNLTLGLQYNF